MNKCFSDRICLLCLFDFNSFCISYYWMFSTNKKFYIWKDWQIILVFNWFCTDRASERITDCLTCSWALLFCWEMLLINFSLLGVFVLIWICCCFYILFCFFYFASGVFKGGGVAGCCVLILAFDKSNISFIADILISLSFTFMVRYVKVGFFWQRHLYEILIIR